MRRRRRSAWAACGRTAHVQRALHLEQAVHVAGLHELEGVRVVEGNLVHIDIDAMVGLYVGLRLRDDRERAQPQEVHLEEAHVGDRMAFVLGNLPPPLVSSLVGTCSFTGSRQMSTAHACTPSPRVRPSMESAESMMRCASGSLAYASAKSGLKFSSLPRSW